MRISNINTNFNYSNNLKTFKKQPVFKSQEIDEQEAKRIEQFRRHILNSEFEVKKEIDGYIDESRQIYEQSKLILNDSSVVKFNFENKLKKANELSKLARDGYYSTKLENGDNVSINFDDTMLSIIVKNSKQIFRAYLPKVQTPNTYGIMNEKNLETGLSNEYIFDMKTKELGLYQQDIEVDGADLNIQREYRFDSGELSSFTMDKVQSRNGNDSYGSKYQYFNNKLQSYSENKIGNFARPLMNRLMYFDGNGKLTSYYAGKFNMAESMNNMDVKLKINDDQSKILQKNISNSWPNTYIGEQFTFRNDKLTNYKGGIYDDKPFRQEARLNFDF